MADDSSRLSTSPQFFSQITGVQRKFRCVGQWPNWISQPGVPILRSLQWSPRQFAFHRPSISGVTPMLRIDQSSTRVPGDGPPASADAHNLCDCEATKLPFHLAPSECPAPVASPLATWTPFQSRRAGPREGALGSVCPVWSSVIQRDAT